MREPVLAGPGASRAGGGVLDRLRMGAPSIGGSRIKTPRSRFTVNDLDTLSAGTRGAGPAATTVEAWPGQPRQPHSRGSRADRARAGTVSLGQRVVLAAEILADRRLGIYIEQGAPLLLFDPETRPQHVVRFGSQVDLQGIIATSSDDLFVKIVALVGVRGLRMAGGWLQMPWTRPWRGDYGADWLHSVATFRPRKGVQDPAELT
jgi:hypothetical protein